MLRCLPAPAPLAFDPEDAQHLGDGGVLLWEDVFTVETAERARAAILAADAQGQLTPAGIGLGASLDRTVRGDRTTWLEPGDLDGALAPLRADLEAILESARRDLWLPAHDLELQAAVYPADGAAYARHLDALRDDNERLLTVIAWLNPRWQPHHGGQLRVWRCDHPTDIAPHAGRVAVFRSDAVPHAVLPCWAPRVALSGWIRRAPHVPIA